MPISFQNINYQGNFTFTSGPPQLGPVAPSLLEVLVVAGGGGGLSNGGAGGAGGLLYGNSFSISSSTTYTITIGAGGAAGDVGATGRGSNSSIGSAIALGGGCGGYSDWGGQAQATPYANGGSGGGGGYSTPSILTAPGLSTQTNSGGLTGYGNNGGGAYNISYNGHNGGGGGAGGAGVSGEAGVSGAGGVGKQYSISGTSTYYAGGGGAGGYGSSPGSGGLGGGGNGGSATAGAVNTGGGGGSGSYGSSGAGGGSGILIIRYADSYTAASNTTGSPNVTVSGGYRVYQFTSSGTITF